MDDLYPEITVEVIEIDPAVTEISHKYLGLSRDTRIVTYNEDARMAIPKLPKGKYGLIVFNVVNDVAVPFQLATTEFNKEARELMTDEGVFLANVIDKFQSGTFLRSYISTLQETFSYVYVLRRDARWEDDSRKTHQLIATFQPVTVKMIEDANLAAGRGQLESNFMPEEMLASWLNAKDAKILTDDYAPVENMAAPL